MRNAIRNSKEEYWQEFIGMDLRVVDSSHGDYMGMNGTVVNETKGTFKITTESGDKIIPKAGQTFLLNGMEIQGRRIMFRPEDRIKRIR